MSRQPVIGDRVEYVSDGHIVSGILAECWTSQLSGTTRARVCDTHAESRDPDALLSGAARIRPPRPRSVDTAAVPASLVQEAELVYANLTEAAQT